MGRLKEELSRGTSRHADSVKPLVVGSIEHQRESTSTPHNPKVAGSNPAPATKKPWPAQRWPGLLPYSDSLLPWLPPGLLPAAGDQSLEGAGGFGLHTGEHVLVDVDGERSVAMSESLAYHLDRDTGFDQQGAVSMADVVETDLGDAGSGNDPLECLRDGVGVDRIAVDVGEHPSRRLDPYRRPLCRLPRPPPA
jgi:hypothetical protein